MTIFGWTAGGCEMTFLVRFDPGQALGGFCLVQLKQQVAGCVTF